MALAALELGRGAPRMETVHFHCLKSASVGTLLQQQPWEGQTAGEAMPRSRPSGKGSGCSGGLVTLFPKGDSQLPGEKQAGAQGPGLSFPFFCVSRKPLEQM